MLSCTICMSKCVHKIAVRVSTAAGCVIRLTNRPVMCCGSPLTLRMFRVAAWWGIHNIVVGSTRPVHCIVSQSANESCDWPASLQYSLS